MFVFTGLYTYQTILGLAVPLMFVFTGLYTYQTILGLAVPLMFVFTGLYHSEFQFVKQLIMVFTLPVLFNKLQEFIV